MTKIGVEGANIYSQNGRKCLNFSMEKLKWEDLIVTMEDNFAFRNIILIDSPNSFISHQDKRHSKTFWIMVKKCSFHQICPSGQKKD